MLKYLRDKFHVKKTDDKGSAIVMVIIAIAFVGMLVAMIVYMAYMNYLMKYTDRSAKDNFYTAESALDELNVGLQADISDALTNAYTYALSGSLNASDTDQQAKFESKFEETLLLNLQLRQPTDSSTAAYHEDLFLEHMKGYWVSTPKRDLTATPAITVGAELQMNGDAKHIMGETIFRMEGIHVTYTNDKGYVSMIETDIVIQIPKIDFAANMERPDLHLYSLVANDNLIVKNTSQVNVYGNVYGGQEGIQAEQTDLLFDTSAEDAALGRIFTVTAESLNLRNGAEVQNNAHQLWTGNIDVRTSTLNLAGSTYVRDDLTIDGSDTSGNGSTIQLSGDYYGYGDATVSAENSSSILINGPQTTLDLSGLNNFMLAGHAYVGATHYNVSTKAQSDYIEDLAALEEEGNDLLDTETGYPTNESDITLGQSIAMKSDQLIYLVPPECMCFDVTTGAQVLKKNPLTYDEYLKFTSTYIPRTDADGNILRDAEGAILYSDELQYKVVDLAVKFPKMDVSLQAKYGVSYKPIFRKVNGTVLVYYYLFFDSNSQANQFFADYYEADPDTINNYARSYIKSITYNTALGQAADSVLSLAGNMLYTGNDGKLQFRESTFAEDIQNYDSLSAQRDSYYSSYQGLSHCLLKNAATANATQLNSDVFTNLTVDPDDFASIVGPTGSVKVFTTDTGLVAVGVNNAATDTSLGETYKVSSNYRSSDLEFATVIIANGDVEVDVANFRGLIIAGGDIRVMSGCASVRYDANKVVQCMLCKNGDNYLYELLKNGIAYANITGIAVGGADVEAAREEDYVKIASLIQYDNWTKE